ncbi:MAG TPA: ABC transporter substrate-binding protein, partial [Thermoleophilia bacterium]|nr:ABC transporter substrate-binding protein [Thermoleophilia bacterium]
MSRWSRARSSASPRARSNVPFVLFVLLALLVVLAVSLGVASSFAASPSPAPAGKVTLRVGWTAEPDSLNPFLGQLVPAYEVEHLNYDYLVGVKAADYSPTPELATEWSQTADGKTWTFKLREGVAWQDGEPFTAQDVAFTFNFIIEHPDEASNFTNYTGFLKQVTVIDDHTVQFECTRAKANMLGMIVPILPAHIWSQMSPKEVKKFQNPPPIVGTGPFQVVEWKKNGFIKLEANPGYWRGRPKVDEVIFQYYTNPDSMTADLKLGALQVAWDIPPAQFEALSGSPDLKTLGAEVNWLSDLGFNCDTSKESLGHPALRDPAFRQALNWAIDRDAIVATAYFGRATPGTSLIRPDFYSNPDWHWEPPAGELYTYDPEKAKAALDAAGYRDTDSDGVRDHKGKAITLRLFVRAQSESDQRAGKLLAGWLDAVGLKVKLQVIDEGALIDKVWNTNEAGDLAPDYDLFIWYWSPDPDPNFILSVLTTSQVGWWSDTYYSDAEYDRLFEEQTTTVDPQARRQIIWRMQQIVHRDSPYVVLCYPQQLEAYDVSKWAGWVQAPANGGGVVLNQFNIDSYVFAHPLATATSSGENGGSVPTVTW